MFLYLVVGWAFSIFVIYLFTLAICHNSDAHKGIRKP
jgi:hypothetical protein